MFYYKTMTKEDKELLLLDLSARLLYGVYCQGITKEYNEDKDAYIDKEITNTLLEVHHYKCSYGHVGLMNECNIETIKPYLRSISSMTEEERKEYKHLVAFSGSPNGAANFVDWLNKNHFDYRNLIERGLAIEVTKENNPYKE